MRISLTANQSDIGRSVGTNKLFGWGKNLPQLQGFSRSDPPYRFSMGKGDNQYIGKVFMDTPYKAGNGGKGFLIQYWYSPTPSECIRIGNDLIDDLLRMKPILKTPPGVDFSESIYAASHK